MNAWNFISLELRFGENNEKSMIIENYLCSSSISDIMFQSELELAFHHSWGEIVNRTNGNESISCPAERKLLRKHSQSEM
jgi:hypothetical protein